VRELVASGGATVIAGPLLTEPSVAAAQTAREVGVPLVSFSKSESFTTGGGIFRLGATTTSQIEALVNAAYGEYHLTRFAVAYPQTASGAEFVEVFKRKLSSLGLTLELEIAYVAGNEASMLNVAQQLDGSAAEAVLIPDTIESSERFISSLSPTVKKRIRPLGTALWDNAQKIARSQALFERSIFVTPFFTQSVRPEVQQFMEAYRAKYSAAPNFLAAQGFDAGILLVNALRKSAESAQPFDRALSQATPLQGVTGAIAVLPSGEIQRSFYVVEVLRDSFQEKLPSSSVTRFDPTAPTAPGIAQSSTPRLGDGERVESGY
jgi:branched-chain amino acid transport system substrate-binding protein